MNSGHVHVTNIESRRTLVTQSVHEKLIRYVNRDQLSEPIKERIPFMQKHIQRSLLEILMSSAARYPLSLRSGYVIRVHATHYCCANGTNQLKRKE